jgi:hypothetical protein
VIEPRKLTSSRRTPDLARTSPIFNTCNIGYSLPASDTQQQDQRVALRKPARRLSNSQEVAKFGGGKDFGVFGFHLPFSEYARKSSLLREKKR